MVETKKPDGTPDGTQPPEDGKGPEIGGQETIAGSVAAEVFAELHKDRQAEAAAWQQERTILGQKMSALSELQQRLSTMPAATPENVRGSVRMVKDFIAQLEPFFADNPRAEEMRKFIEFAEAEVAVIGKELSVYDENITRLGPGTEYAKRFSDKFFGKFMPVASDRLGRAAAYVSQISPILTQTCQARDQELELKIMQAHPAAEAHNPLFRLPKLVDPDSMEAREYAFLQRLKKEATTISNNGSSSEDLFETIMRNRSDWDERQKEDSLFSKYQKPIILADRKAYSAFIDHLGEDILGKARTFADRKVFEDLLAGRLAGIKTEVHFDQVSREKISVEGSIDSKTASSTNHLTAELEGRRFDILSQLYKDLLLKVYAGDQVSAHSFDKDAGERFFARLIYNVASYVSIKKLIVASRAGQLTAGRFKDGYQLSYRTIAQEAPELYGEMQAIFDMFLSVDRSKATEWGGTSFVSALRSRLATPDEGPFVGKPFVTTDGVKYYGENEQTTVYPYRALMAGVSEKKEHPTDVELLYHPGALGRELDRVRRQALGVVTKHDEVVAGKDKEIAELKRDLGRIGEELAATLKALSTEESPSAAPRDQATRVARQVRELSDSLSTIKRISEQRGTDLRTLRGLLGDIEQELNGLPLGWFSGKAQARIDKLLASVRKGLKEVG